MYDTLIFYFIFTAIFLILLWSSNKQFKLMCDHWNELTKQNFQLFEEFIKVLDVKNTLERKLREYEKGVD